MYSNNGGELGSKKGVNVPNVSIKLPGITDKDKDDIIFGIEQGFDFIAGYKSVELMKKHVARTKIDEQYALRFHL